MNNPLNLCPHGLTEDGNCDECRFEYEASEAAYAEKLEADEEEHGRYLTWLDTEGTDPYGDEPFFEVAL